MKTLYLGTEKQGSREQYDYKNDLIFQSLINEYSLLESNIVYFSAGEAKIKEILIEKEPLFSI